LILRRRAALPGEGRVLRKIWPLISMHTLVEFKSVSRPPRPGDVTRLYGYGSQYHVAQIHDVGDAKMRGPTYPSFLVLLAEVAEAERDPWLGAFGRRMLDRTDREAWTWLIAHLRTPTEQQMRELEGYEDYVEAIRKAVPPEILVDLLRPEERVAGLKPEERRAGLAPDETVLVLADEILRLLPDEFIERLPEPIRAEVRRRLGSPG
jgi:hypothetical protein